jgi:16S rRNA processing protein RimM
MAASDPLLLARIGKPHGIRGEVTVQVHTDDPQARFAPGLVYATQAAADSGVPRELTIAASRLHRDVWLLRFEEIPDRTGAESLRDTRLMLDAEAAATEDEDDQNAWYERDLVGLAAHDPAGRRLGEVTGLVLGSAQDLLRVRLEDGREGLVPFVERLVPVVDVAGGRVVIDAPPGLFDLEA